MELALYCKCKSCGEVIIDAAEGVIIQGNLYAAHGNKASRGVIIGTEEFQTRIEVEEDSDSQLPRIATSSIPINAYCRQCFENTLPWS